MKKLFVILSAILIAVLSATAVFAKDTASDEYIIYVSPDGDDTGDGSYGNMLKTPAGAQAHLRASGKLGKQPVRVVFMPGDYHMSEGLKFIDLDKGTAKCPVVWEAEKRGTVNFKGTTVLDNSLFVPVTDTEMLSRIPTEARDKVLQLDLAANGINIPEVRAYMWNRMNNKSQPNTALLRNGKEQILSRWPNGESNYAFFDKVLAPGALDAPFGDLKNGVQIEFNNPRISRWETATHAYITGHTSVTFSIDYLDVQKIDSARGVIHTIGADEYKPKESSPKGFQIVNLIEELDTASEWYIDYDKQILYYYPPSEINDDTLLELITMNEATLDFATDVEFHITFRNIGVIGSRRRLVYSTGRNVSFDGCTFMYSKEREAIYIHAKEFMIENCVIAHHDGRGISFGGEAEIKKAIRKYSTIRNNYFYDLGNLSTSLGHAIISTSGSGVDIYQNSMHYLPQGTFLGGWDVCDVRLFYNEFYNYGRNLSDMGGFYIGYCGSAIGTEVAYNYFYDYLPANPNIGRAVQGVYFDDGAHYGYVHHNTFINGAGYGVQIGGGKYNRAESNIMINMGSGPFTTDARVEDWSNGPTIAQQTHSQSAQRLQAVPRFSKIYPWTNHIEESHRQAPYGNVIRNNLSDKKFNLNKRMVELGKVENNYLLEDYSHFVDPDNYDFRLRDDSVFAKTIPELTESEYNLDSVGCSLDVTEHIDCSFGLLSPAKGAEFDSNGSSLIWEKATMADKYIITIATDKDMQNVIYTDTVSYNYCIVEGLEDGKEYYWQVEAVNTSLKRKTSWKSDISSFVNKSTTANRLDDVLYYIGTTEYALSTADLALYPESSANDLRSAISEARRFYNASKRSGNVSVEEIDAQIATLDAAKDSFHKSEIINYTSFNPEYFKDTSHWILNGTDATVTDEGLRLVKGESDKIALSALKEMPGKNDVVTFRGKIDHLTDSMEGSWISLELRRINTDKHAYNDAGVMILIKRHKIEVQTYRGAGGGGIVTTVDNVWTKDGQWHEFAVGAINKPDSLRLVLVIDGEVVVNHVDYANLCDFEGHFATFVSQSALTLAPSQMEYGNIETGVSTYLADKTGYTEEGSWEIADIKGEAGNNIKKTSSSDAKATWTINNIDGHKRVYFRKNAVADGDTKAKLTVSTDHVGKMTGEEATKEISLDFASGESEWVLIDEERYQAGSITITLSGSGAGGIYADAVRIEDKED